ncbi:antitoxin [Hoyosella sp. G463]|uniref:Antitoxin n=1 Tax=Lolliginicoccus lacisalsi TaxID=2742202 RepID=A0A927J9E8_9ACTN|nr:antitoxin [Lolliginicoccus lacisalsi]MBD8505018.1 antitoxin [Lolliginicoccus lacisalsi]
MGFGDIMNKAKNLAQQNPDKARAAIDKVEDTIDEKTGSKYGDHIRKGGDTVEGHLGISEQEAAEAGQQQEQAADTQQETTSEGQAGTKQADNK